MTKAESAFLKRATKLVDKWKREFGFGHFRSVVRLPSSADRQDCWGLTDFDFTEEWFHIELNPLLDTNEELEWVIIHELSHGLIEYANSGDIPLETVCSRIPKLILGRSGPNTLLNCGGV